MLEALGNLGDFVGGLAVVATLIYLAVQVRQNTEQLRRSAELEYVDASESTFASFSRFRAQIVSNPGLAELYYKGTIDPRSLDPVERLRFNMLAEELFFILQTSFGRLSTVAPTVEIEARKLGVDILLRSSGLSQWWSRQKGRFDPDFVAFIDSQISDSTPET